MLVVGDHTPGPFDRAALAATDVALLRDHVIVDRGRGTNALGGPVDAIAWLLQLPGTEGLTSGSIVTTGTLTAAQPISPGESWRSEYNGPELQCRLEVTFA